MVAAREFFRTQLKQKFDVDYHLLFAQKAMRNLLTIARDNTADPEIQRGAKETVEFLQRHGILNPELSLDALYDLTDRDKIQEFDSQNEGVRTFHKPGTMDRTYSAGLETIINDLKLTTVTDSGVKQRFQFILNFS